MLKLSLQTSFITFYSRGTHYGTSSAETLLVENINSSCLLEIQDNNSISGSALKNLRECRIKLKDRGRLLPEKSLLFIGDYPNYEMWCFKTKMSASKRLIDSKELVVSIKPFKVGSHDPIFSSNCSSAHFLRQQLDVWTPIFDKFPTFFMYWMKIEHVLFPSD